MVPGPPPRSGNFSHNPGTTVRVKGLDPKLRNTDLQPVFGDYGHVLRIQIVQNKGLAFVEFRERGDATEAIRHLNGEQVLGCTLTVTEAGPPQERRRGGGGDDSPPRGAGPTKGNATEAPASSADGRSGRSSRSQGDPERDRSRDRRASAGRRSRSRRRRGRSGSRSDSASRSRRRRRR
mmetsp:Transcript_3125/g.7041  ORF Transcript_3125/g.7041 Transcript_3125/m.7041 type:complete len:179 (+) Transcript_3125:110-646(+)